MSEVIRQYNGWPVAEVWWKGGEGGHDTYFPWAQRWRCPCPRLTSATVRSSPKKSNPDTDYNQTGKERDTESGNDYFEARYCASSMGRFMYPD
jgi:hypothetical protein